MTWLFKFFKGGKTISQAIKEFFKMNGRMPNARETLKMKDIFRQSQSNVIQFPKDRITDWWKPRPGKGEVVSLDKDPLKGMRDRIQPGSLLDDLAKKDPNAAATHIRNMDITDQHMNKITTGKINYKEMEKLLGVKLKGDETWSELKNIQKKKFPEPSEDITFTDERPPKDPEFASGGVAGQLHLYDGGRASFGKGKLVKGFFEFVEGLFIKASNDIRQGKGLFKGLDQKQKMVQHDNLTKMVEQWQKTKKLPEGAEQYFGVDAKKAFAAAETKVKKVKKVKKDRVATAEELEDAREIVDPSGEAYIVEEGMTVGQLDDLVADHNAYMADMKSQYMRGDLDKYVKPEVLEEQRLFRQKKIDNVLAKAYDEVFYQKPVSGDYKLDADVLADSIAEQLGKGAFTDLPQTHQTQIYNTALKRVTQDMKMKQTLKKVEEKMILSDFDPKGRKPNASGGIAGQLHLNRPGYQQGNEVLPPELRALKREDNNLPYWASKIMSYDKDVMPEEYKIPGSGGYGSVFRHAGNTALLKKHLSEKMEPYTGKGIADLAGAIGAFGGGTLHELTAESPIWADEKRTVDEALPFDVGPSKKLSAEFKEDMLANLYGALYGKTGIKDKEVLDRLIERLSRKDNWSEIFQELIGEQAREDPERPWRIMPQMIRVPTRNRRPWEPEFVSRIIDSPFSNKRLEQKEFIEKMEDKGKLATSATEGSFAKGGLAHVLGV